jgi:hypothetical protein
VSFSQTNTILSEIDSDGPLSEATQAYLEARAKNSFYDYVYGKFRDAEAHGLTKARLARRLNKKPDQISHLLGAPGNWRISTIVSLLAGICKEELVPHSSSFVGRPGRNRQSMDLLEDSPEVLKRRGADNPTSITVTITPDPTATVLRFGTSNSPPRGDKDSRPRSNLDMKNALSSLSFEV